MPGKKPTQRRPTQATPMAHAVTIAAAATFQAGKSRRTPRSDAVGHQQQQEKPPRQREKECRADVRINLL